MTKYLKHPFIASPILLYDYYLLFFWSNIINSFFNILLIIEKKALWKARCSGSLAAFHCSIDQF